MREAFWDAVRAAVEEAAHAPYEVVDDYVRETWAEDPHFERWSKDVAEHETRGSIGFGFDEDPVGYLAYHLFSVAVARERDALEELAEAFGYEIDWRGGPSVDSPLYVDDDDAIYIVELGAANSEPAVFDLERERVDREALSDDAREAHDRVAIERRCGCIACANLREHREENEAGASGPGVAKIGPFARAFAVSPKDPRTMVAADGARLRVSHDGGATWHRLSRPPPFYGALVDSVAFVDDALFAATLAPSADRVWAAIAPEALEPLYVSADAGATWRSASSGLALAHLTHLAAAPTNPNTLFATGLASDRVANERVFVSEDRGATWRVACERIVAASSTVGRIDSLAVASALRLYAIAGDDATWRKLLESDDGGVTWRRIAPPSIGFLRTVHAADPSRSDAIVVTGEAGIAASDDGGASYRVVRKGGDATFVASRVAPFTWFAHCVEDTLVRSDDLGASWTSIAEASWVTGIIADPIERGVAYVATPAGLFRT